MSVPAAQPVTFRPAMDQVPEATVRLRPGLVPELLVGGFERIEHELSTRAWELAANPGAMPKGTILELLDLVDRVAKLRASVRTNPTR